MKSKESIEACIQSLISPQKLSELKKKAEHSEIESIFTIGGEEILVAPSFLLNGTFIADLTLSETKLGFIKITTTGGFEIDEQDKLEIYPVKSRWHF